MQFIFGAEPKEIKTYCFLSFLACGSWGCIRVVLLSFVGHDKVVKQEVIIVVTPLIQSSSHAPADSILPRSFRGTDISEVVYFLWNEFPDFEFHFSNEVHFM